MIARLAPPPQDHGAIRPVPAGRRRIEIGEEAVAVGIGGAKPTIFQPEGVRRAELLAERIRPVGQPVGRFLVGMVTLPPTKPDSPLFRRK